jgi:hypothetical protein
MSARSFKMNVFNRNQGQIRVERSLEAQGVVTRVQMYQTIIVEYWVNHIGPSPTIVLNSGGYRTASTKTAINQALSQLVLPWNVIQRKGQWLVTNGVKTFDFIDGIQLDATGIVLKEAS